MALLHVTCLINTCLFEQNYIIKYLLLQILSCHVTMFPRICSTNPKKSSLQKVTNGFARCGGGSHSLTGGGEEVRSHSSEKHGSNWGVVTCDLEITLVICSLDVWEVFFMDYFTLWEIYCIKNHFDIFVRVEWCLVNEVLGRIKSCFFFSEM